MNSLKIHMPATVALLFLERVFHALGMPASCIEALKATKNNLMPLMFVSNKDKHIGASWREREGIRESERALTKYDINC